MAKKRKIPKRPPLIIHKTQNRKLRTEHFEPHKVLQKEKNILLHMCSPSFCSCMYTPGDKSIHIQKKETIDCVYDPSSSVKEIFPKDFNECIPHIDT